MELRAGYKQTEVGVIPEDWDESEAFDLNPFITSGSRGWAKYYAESGAPFIRITNLSRSSIYPDIDDLKFVALPVTEKEGLRTAVRDGDILISITADIGIIGYLEKIHSPSYINQHIACLRIGRQKANGKFLAYYLASEQPQRRFRDITDVGAKTGINLTAVGQLKLVLPPLPEQDTIATALSDADALIDALDALIAKKRDLKQEAMQQLLTGKTRLPGFNGDWKVKQLGDHVRFLKNGTLSRAQLSADAPVKYLHYGDIHSATNLWLRPSLVEMPMVESKAVESLDQLKDGDLIFVDASEDLEGVGKSIEITDCSGIDVVSGLHTIAARFDKDILADSFKAYLQFMPPFRRHLRSMAAGTKVLATNRKHIASVKMALPDPAEQTAIASVLLDMDTELAALGAKRDKARAIKQGMMQELMTGRIRLV